MKILLFIDNLGSGGAQRQLVNLAIGFKQHGNDVSFLVYSENDFYSELLTKNQIKIFYVNTTNYIKRVFLCRKHIRSGNYNVVLSFLETPSLIAELSSLPFHKWKLIVGERSSSPKILSTFKGRFMRLMHIFADVVVSNSETNKNIVQRANPFLSDKKNKTIYNLYDLDKLNPNFFKKEEQKDDYFHLIVAASHQYLKNLKNLAVAISLLDGNLRKRLRIEWYGKKINPCYSDSLNIIKELGIEDNFSFFDPTLDIYKKMIQADAVGLFSIYEGLSNTICEAMSLGKAVITTDISDNKKILDNDHLISDPKDPTSISKSLEYLLDMSIKEIEEEGKKNRRIAEELFDKNNIINKYISLMK